MRVVALAAFACALGLSLPCAAQSETTQAELPQTSSVAKQSRPAAPQLLAPPQESLPATNAPVITHASPPQPILAPVPVLASPEPEAMQPQRSEGSFSTPERLVDWVYNYHAHPTPWRVPAAVRAMRELGLFTDEEKGAFCTGFIAGVLGANAKDGPALVGKMLPMPDKDQAVLIRAIAFSGRPDWRELLTKYKDRMPLRQPLIDSYLSGKAKTLMEIDLSDGPSVVYTLWGYYVATGQYEPVVRIMQALRWSKNKNDGNFSLKKIFSNWRNDPSAVDKISTGATAKWTLASYAERNRDLLSLYRAEYEHQPKEIAQPLRDVIVAAESFESEKIRKDQFGAIEDAQKLQATNEAGMSKAATAGSIAIATGCVAASALGQIYIAVPCVIGGALYTGAMKLMH
ncbi:MAG TPA: hypothetical protein VKD00_01470 [Methyloceanibacter sp.]|nr:hypothetical protein [Methyloceanibacter sp.]